MACKRSRVRLSYSPRTRQPFGLPFFVRGEYEIRGEVVTSEALLIKGGFGRIVKIPPQGCSEHPEFDSRILHAQGNLFGCLFLCVENGCYPPPKSPSCEGDFSRAMAAATFWGCLFLCVENRCLFQCKIQNSKFKINGPSALYPNLLFLLTPPL